MIHLFTILYSILPLKDTLKAFNDFKNKQNSVWSNVFWYVKVHTFWKCIQYSIHWDRTQILKKFSSDKINGTKNVLFFLSRAPTQHSFTFNLRFFSESKDKVLSKTMCVGFSIFNSFAPRLLIFKLQQEVLKFNNICLNWSSSKTDLMTNFLNLENQNFEC